MACKCCCEVGEQLIMTEKRNPGLSAMHCHAPIICRNYCVKVKALVPIQQVVTTRYSEAKRTCSCILNAGCPLLWGSCSICCRSCCCRSCCSPTPITVASVSPALQQHLPSCSWLPLLTQRPICLHSACLCYWYDWTHICSSTDGCSHCGCNVIHSCAFCCCYCHNVQASDSGFDTVACNLCSCADLRTQV